MTNHRSFIAARMPRRENGFSLIELMIGTAIGLIILAALSYVLVSNIQSRTELEKGSRQLESGRFALAMLNEDIQLAGFYGEYFPATTGMTVPDPCSRVLQEMGFADANYRWNTSAPAKVPVGIYGFTDAENPLPAATTSCATFLTNRKADTDILVVRRASTAAIAIDADANNSADADVTMEDGTTATYASLGNAYYLQASNCSEVGAATEFAFVMDHDTSRFTLHKTIQAGAPLSCMNGTLNTLRRYVVRIFYISTCNVCGDGGDTIPTLKMAELTSAGSAVCTADTSTACGTFTVRAIADGIENLQLEYGIDSDLDGVPDAFSEAPTAAEWENVVAVKTFLLARNIEASPGYTNDNTYFLNTLRTLTVTPNDSYKRHLYFATSKAINLAGRRS